MPGEPGAFQMISQFQKQEDPQIVIFTVQTAIS